jgi:hypothetical protein
MNIKAIIHEAEEGGFWAEVPRHLMKLAELAENDF